jgi:serine/threonine-protein kinase
LVRKDGSTKLVDFGLAAATIDQNTFAGSPAYMAPKQITSPGDLDHRVDMYGLGATLFHASTGAPPFVRATTIDTIRAQLEDQAPQLDAVVPGYSTALAGISAALLAKDRNARPARWDDVIVSLMDLSLTLQRGETGADSGHRTISQSLKNMMSSLWRKGGA